MIYNINSFKKAADANAFNLNPGSDAGVGPFRLKSYKPKELIEFERNPGYWRGADNVNLDGLKFVFIGDPQQPTRRSRRYVAVRIRAATTGPFNAHGHRETTTQSHTTNHAKTPPTQTTTHS
jgi:ABC-type oligopeptide transport system substrate-binding subunit